MHDRSKTSSTQLQTKPDPEQHRHLYLEREDVPDSHSDRPRNHSPIIELAFVALHWLFLLLIGFVIAIVLSSSLQATSVVAALKNLLSQCFVPLVALTFCIMAGAVILESLRK